MTFPTSNVVRLLVVDDDLRFPDYLRVMLGRTRTAFEIDTVETVADALRQLAQERYDVCLVDYRLGIEDGLDVPRRAQPRGLRTPIVLLTGEGDESLEFTALEEGATDYLHKSEIDPLRLERVICRAISRHRAEAALHERELRLANAEAFTLVMPTHIALDGQWVKVPRRLCELLGYTEDELLNMRYQDVTHPDDVANHVEQHSRLVAGAVRSIELEKRYLAKDGHLVWTYQNCSLVSSEDGVPLYFLAYLRDITDQKRADEECKALEEQLRQSQKMEAIGQLAGGVAHDFNNLLTAILGYTDLLREACSDMPAVIADLDEIHNAGTSAASLTEQLLAFSRKQVVQPEIVSINDVVKRMQNLLSRVLGEDIALTTTLGADLPPIEADPVHMEQVILNLAANARDAMPRGGRLLIETAAADLLDTPSFACSMPGQRWIALSVKDTGSGIDAATKAHIFEPFFTTKAHGKGTGLGLSTVYGIVTQAGGEITCESAAGAGTKFTVLLPATEKVVRGVAPPSAYAVKGSATVLVVEDQESVRRLTRRILEPRGYCVIETGDPHEAVALAAASPIDLLLTDVVMPDMNGAELAALMRARFPNVAVLFMSGFAEHSALNDIKGAPFIHKPFAPHDLAARVNDVLGGRDPERSSDRGATIDAADGSYPTLRLL